MSTTKDRFCVKCTAELKSHAITISCSSCSQLVHAKCVMPGLVNPLDVVMLASPSSDFFFMCGHCAKSKSRLNEYGERKLTKNLDLAVLENGMANESLAIINHKLNTVIRLQQEIGASVSKSAYTDSQFQISNHLRMNENIQTENHTQTGDHIQTDNSATMPATKAASLHKSSSSCTEHVWHEIDAETNAFVQNERRKIDTILSSTRLFHASPGINRSILEPSTPFTANESFLHRRPQVAHYDTSLYESTPKPQINTDDHTENKAGNDLTLNQSIQYNYEAEKIVIPITEQIAPRLCRRHRFSQSPRQST